MTENATITNTKTPYDLVPYESYPYEKTDIGYLYSVAKLFSIDAPDYKKSKVLELGCASAGNIIPMAIRYPNSHFTGIDLSENQIEYGQEYIEDLGLTNINIETKSILDIDENFGKFDYIIVHGIFSWVSTDVQDKILEICNTNLSKNGIAYVSYNTFPGWNMVKSVRDMMLYHTKNIQFPIEKVKQAKALLQFVEESISNPEDPYAKIIHNERELLEKATPDYFLHDHLSEVNCGFYFSDFNDKAKSKGLQYVADTDLHSMYLENLPKKVSETLSQVKNDLISTEQYMDFIRNRRFRSSIICSKNVNINRNIQPKTLEELYFANSFYKTNEKQDNNILFKCANGMNFSTPSVGMAHAIQIMNEAAPKVLSGNQIVDKVVEAMGKDAQKDKIKHEILQNFARLIFAGGLSLQGDIDNITGKISEKPVASRLARYQASTGSWVTSQRSKKIDLDKFDKIFLQYLDGDSDVDSLCDKMMEHAKRNHIKLQKDDKDITDLKELEPAIKQISHTKLQKYANLSLLVA